MAVGDLLKKLADDLAIIQAEYAKEQAPPPTTTTPPPTTTPEPTPPPTTTPPATEKWVGGPVADTFGRADANTLGTAESGHGWTANLGTWAIAANKAKLSATSSGAWQVATVDARFPDGALTATIVPTNGFNGGVLARFSDLNNFVMVNLAQQADRCVAQVFRRQSGTVTSITTPVTIMSAPGATCTVELRLWQGGGQAWVNGTSLGKFTVSGSLLGGTRVGLVAQGATATTWDNVRMDLPLRLNAHDEWASVLGVVVGGKKWTPADIVAGKSPLTKKTGVLATTAAGQIIENVWLDGAIRVLHSNVTIRNCFVRGSKGATSGGNDRTSNNSPALIATGIAGGGTGDVTGIVIENCHIHNTTGTGTETPTGDVVPGHPFDGIAAVNYTMRRSIIEHFVIGVWALQNVVIEDSLFYNNSSKTYYSNAGAYVGGDGHHSDQIDCDSGKNVSIRRTYATFNVNGQRYTAAVQWGGSWEPPDRLSMDRSFVYGNDGGGMHIAERITNCSVTNCAFGNQPPNAVKIGNPVQTWTGNYLSETGEAINYWGGKV